MKKLLILLLSLLLVLATACSSEPAAESGKADQSQPGFDVMLTTAKQIDLTYPLPVLNECDSESLNGESKTTYTFTVNGKKAALEIRTSSDPEAFKEYLTDGSQLRSVNGIPWGVGAVADNGIVTYNCRTTYEGITYLVHAEEPEDLYFFESQILPQLVLASVS